MKLLRVFGYVLAGIFVAAVVWVGLWSTVYDPPTPGPVTSWIHGMAILVIIIVVAYMFVASQMARALWKKWFGGGEGE